MGWRPRKDKREKGESWQRTNIHSASWTPGIRASSLTFLSLCLPQCDWLCASDCQPEQLIPASSCFIESEPWQLAQGWGWVLGKSLCLSTFLKPLRRRKKKICRYFGHIPVSDCKLCLCFHCLPGVQVKLCGYCPWVARACGTLAFNSMPLSQWGRSAFSHPVCSHIISKCRISRHSSLYLPRFLCSELGIYWSISPYPQRRRLRFHF